MLFAGLVWCVLLLIDVLVVRVGAASGGDLRLLARWLGHETCHHSHVGSSAALACFWSAVDYLMLDIRAANPANGAA